MERVKIYIHNKIRNLIYISVSIILIFMFVVIHCETGRGDQTIISMDTTWTLANSPYIIKGNVLVENSVSLTMEPGVEVKFDGFYYMQIEGKLIAEGTENNMITFTSNKESPAPRDWRSIKFMKNTDYGSSLKYCKIEYGYTAIALDNINHNTAPNITHCIIKDNSWVGIEYYTSGDSSINSWKQITNNTIMNTADGYGLDINFYVNSINASLFVSNNVMKFNGGNVIACSSNEGNMIITNNILINNEGPGIVCHGDNVNIEYNLIAHNDGPGIVIAGAAGDYYCIEHNTIMDNNDANDKYGGGINFEQHESSTNIYFRYNNLYNNTPYDAYNGRESDINISDNWWGTIDTEVIDEQINDYYDNFNRGKINYKPFLTEPDPYAPDPSSYLDEPIDSDNDENNSTPGFEGFYLICILIIIVLLIKIKK